MPVFHLNDLPKEKRIQMIGEFYDTIDSLKDRVEVRSFFKSLLTPEEIATLMRRIEIAVLLSAKYKFLSRQYPYSRPLRAQISQSVLRWVFLVA